jgi:hypothetical protein
MLWPALVHAAPTDEEKAVARTLFEQGRGLVKAGRWAEACPKLVESQRLDPGIGTLFNVADCHEHTGKPATAWVEFSEVADLAKQAGQGEREKIARDRARALDPKIARVTLRASAPLAAGSDVTLDGRPIGTAALDLPVPLDPGPHKVAVVENGRATEKDFDIAANAAGAIEVTLPAPAAAPAVAVLPPPEPPRAASWHRPVAIGAGALGLTAIGVSVALGFVATGQWNDVRGRCPANQCAPSAYSGWEESRTTAAIGTGVFIGGAVLVAAAAVLWFLDPQRER